MKVIKSLEKETWVTRRENYDYNWTENRQGKKLRGALNSDFYYLA